MKHTLHDCSLGDINVFEDENGLMYIKERCFMPHGQYHTNKVEYCPICGMKAKNSHIASFSKGFISTIPDIAPDESITRFSQALSTAIDQMNHNVEIIKCFMISQNTQNDCFRFVQNELQKKIDSLDNKILEGGNDEISY